MKKLFFIFAFIPTLSCDAAEEAYEIYALPAEEIPTSSAWDKAKVIFHTQLPKEIVSVVEKQDAAYRAAVASGKGPEKIDLKATANKFLVLVGLMQNNLSSTRGEHAILLTTNAVMNKAIDSAIAALKLKDAPAELILTPKESLVAGEIAEEFDEERSNE